MLKRVPIPSPNYSSRGGAGVRLVVLHTAEGARTYQSLGNYFKSSSVQASSHVGIDDTPGTIGEFVRRDYKAWTAAAFNPVAVQVELCAFAKWDLAEWHRHPAMLENCARWIAEECEHYGIPVTRLTPAQARGSGRGVCQHVDLGAAGGGHWDCGPGFPMDEVLAVARGSKPSAPAPPAPPKPKEIEEMASAVAADGTLHKWIVGPARQTAWLTYQKANQTSWNGGEAGKRVAGWVRFADAPKGRTIRDIDACRSAGGALHFWMTLDDASTLYRVQPKGSIKWGNLTPFAPKP